MSLADVITFCDICEKNGERNALQLLQVNFDEAVWLCPNPKCPYPFGLDLEDSKTLVVPRGAFSIGPTKKKRSREPSRSTSCSSSRSGSPLSMTHGKAPWSPKLKVPSPPGSTAGDAKSVSATSITTSLQSNVNDINEQSNVAPTSTWSGESTTSQSITSATISVPAVLPDQNAVGPGAVVPLGKETFALPKLDLEHFRSQRQVIRSGPSLHQLHSTNARSDHTYVANPTIPLSINVEKQQSFAGQNSVEVVLPSATSTTSNQFEPTFTLPPHPSRVTNEIDFKTSSAFASTIAATSEVETCMSPTLKPCAKVVMGAKLGTSAQNKTLHGINPSKVAFKGKMSVQEKPTNVQSKKDSSSTLPTPERNMFLPGASDFQSPFVHKKTQESDQPPTPAQKLKLKGVHFFQWQNKDALCWLDVAMTLLVHSRPFYNIVKSTGAGRCPVAKDLLNSYTETQKLLSKALELKRYQLYGQKHTICLQTSLGIITVKTGGGDNSNFSRSNSNSSPLVISTNLSPIKNSASYNTEDARLVITTEELQARAGQLSNDGKNILTQVRERVWRFLYPKLQCEKGSDDSPVFALPFLVGEDESVKKNFLHTYEWKMTCAICGYRHTDRSTKSLLSLPTVPEDFTMRKPYFIRSCFRCQAPDQKMEMMFDCLPPMLLVHFVDGLHKKLSSYDFFFKGQYTVTGVIQWKQNPDHFVSWVKNPAMRLWMECDDLKHPLCQFKEEEPNFPGSQVHIVMWTKKNVHTSIPYAIPSTPPVPMLFSPPQPPPPLKGVLKKEKSPTILGAKRKVVLDTPDSKPKGQKAVKAAKVAAASSSKGDGGVHGKAPKTTDTKEEKKGDLSRSDLIAKLLSGQKKSVTSERSKAVRTDWHSRKKIESLKPAELAKHILSHGLIPGLSKPLPPVTNYLPVSESTASTSTTNAQPKRTAVTIPSFTGYVPKAVPSTSGKMQLKQKLGSYEKTVQKKTTNELLGNGKWAFMSSNLNKGKKRKLSESASSPVKHVKINESNVIIESGPSYRPQLCMPPRKFVHIAHSPRKSVKIAAPCRKAGQIAQTSASGGSFSKKANPHSVSDVLEELCEKLEVSNVGNKDVEGFSLEELFESGKEGERVKPIESSIDMNVDFDLDMFM